MTSTASGHKSDLIGRSIGAEDNLVCLIEDERRVGSGRSLEGRVDELSGVVDKVLVCYLIRKIVNKT